MITTATIKESQVTQLGSVGPLGFCPLGTKAQFKAKGVFVSPHESVIFLPLGVASTRAIRQQMQFLLNT